MKYNDNIELIREVNRDTELAKDKWFVLMVTDMENRCRRPNKDYWLFEKGYIGLERTGSKIYISKKFNNRYTPYRGITFVAKVKNPNECIDLTY